MDKLFELAKKLNQCYEVDKIKSYGIYVWDIHNGEDQNVFDIYEDRIHYYVDNYQLKKESLDLIKQIQNELKKIRLNKGE